MAEEHTEQEHTPIASTPAQTGAPVPTPTPIMLTPVQPTPLEIMAGNQLTTLALRKSVLPRFNALHDTYCKKSGKRLSKSEFLAILILRFEVEP